MDNTYNYNENDIFVISPKFHIRPNVNSCIIYPFDSEEASTWHIMSFIQGIALTLFDGKRTAKEIAAILSELMSIDIDKSADIVKCMINSSQSNPDKAFLELYSSEHKNGNFTVYDTAKFVRKLKGGRENMEDMSEKLDVPLSLLIMPSNKCDVDCIYCYAHRKNVPEAEMLNLKQWCDIIDEASELGIDIVTFSGGDPLTYPNIEVLLERMVLKGIKFLLPTKKYISKEMAKKFYEIGMADKAIIQISIDGYSENIDKLVRRKNYARDALETIKNLTEYNLFVRTNTVCTPINYMEVPELLRRLHSLGVKRSSVTNYALTHYRHKEELFLSEEQIQWVKNEVSKIKNEFNWEGLSCNAGVRDFSQDKGEEDKESWKTRSHCSGGTSSMSITPDGSVILCEQVPQDKPFIVGNIKNSSIMEIWNSQELLNFIYPDKALFKGTACESCEEFDECHRIYGRCFRDSYFVFNKVFGPPPNCPKAPKSCRMA